MTNRENNDAILTKPTELSGLRVNASRSRDCQQRDYDDVNTAPESPLSEEDYPLGQLISADIATALQN